MDGQMHDVGKWDLLIAHPPLHIPDSNREPMAELPEMTYHEWVTPDGKTKRQSLWYYNTRCLPHDQRAAAASKTFPGIAKAMAEQWGGSCER